MQQRDQQAACTGSKIENPQAVAGVTPLLERDEGGCNHGFAVRAGNQGGRAEREGEAPEFPLAQNAGHGLPFEAAGNLVAEFFCDFVPQSLARRLDQIEMGNPRRAKQEKTRITLCGVDPGAAECLAEGFQGLNPGHIVLKGHDGISSAPSNSA